MIPTVENLPSGGLRITVEDVDTDTLAIVEISNRYGTVQVKTGLRGNYTVEKRPIQWAYHQIKARKMTEEEREQAKTEWWRKNAWRMR